MNGLPSKIGLWIHFCKEFVIFDKFFNQTNAFKTTYTQTLPRT